MATRARTILGLSAGVLGLALATGCEPRKQLVRRSEPPPLMMDADPVQDDPSFQRPEELQGFFKGNRTMGTLSSEAQEIESSLGVGR